MLIIILLSLNLLLSLGLLFWAVNKNCSRCQQEMPFFRVLALKDKCRDCEGGGSHD